MTSPRTGATAGTTAQLLPDSGSAVCKRVSETEPSTGGREEVQNCPDRPTEGLPGARCQAVTQATRPPSCTSGQVDGDVTKLNRKAGSPLVSLPLHPLFHTV